jgi:O-antigen biosynthesis protein
MRVAFLADGPTRRGESGAVVEHVRRLRLDHRIDAQLVRTGGGEAARDEAPVLSLAQASTERWDVAIAASWEDVFVLHHLDAGRYAFFVQAMEERLYGAGDPARLAASQTHDLPLAFIAETRWIAEQLDSAFYVRRGVDKETFSPFSPRATSTDGPLRILVVGDPAAPAEGVPEALAAAGAMSETRTVTLVVTAGSAAPDAPAHHVIGPSSPQELASAYRAHDVVLRLARVDGMPMPPLEGFHCGATCVVTPVTGHDEYVVDGWNGLVVGWDDERGVSRTLDLLTRDRRLLYLLRANAVATARAWPSPRDSSAALALALRQIATAASKDPEREAAARAAAIQATLERSRAGAVPPPSTPRRRRPARQVERLLPRRAIEAMRRATAGCS